MTGLPDEDAAATVLADLLAPHAGRPASLLLVGSRSRLALETHGIDPAWQVTHAELRDQSLVDEGGVALPSDYRAHLVVALDVMAASDYPWLAMQTLSRRLASGGRLVAGAATTGDPVEAGRRLQSLMRWADLHPDAVTVRSDEVLAIASPIHGSGLRRAIGLLRQRVLWQLGTSHGRRRQDRSVAASAPVEARQTTGSKLESALTGVPPSAVYEHRREVLGELMAAGYVTFGHGSYGTPEVLVYGGDAGHLNVGRWSSIADDVQVLVGGNHPTDRASTYPFRARYAMPGMHEDGFPSSKGGVDVGNDVWIGRGALLVSGADVSDGAVVAAGAVVAGHVRPYAIVAGNPAREIRRRFDDDTVERLLALRWWEWPEAELLGIPHLLNDGNPEALLDYGVTRCATS